MYRDEETARERRIAALEERVAQRDTEVATLREKLAQRDSRLRELMARFDGAAAGRTGRGRRYVVAAALSGAALSGAALGWLARPLATEGAPDDGQERPGAAETSDPGADHRAAGDADILADPTDPRRLVAPAPATASHDPAPPRGQSCDPTDPLCTDLWEETAQKRRLLGKATAGGASEVELRMLKAICMNDGDRACRDLAVARLAEQRRRAAEGGPGE